MLSESHDRVGLGLIGLGWWGGVLTSAARQGGAADMVSCFARSEQAREDFAAKHGVAAASSLEAMLEDPTIEGVLIATSHQSHRPLVEKVAAAGKHVFVEKPLTTTVAEGRACVEAAKAAGVLLQVGHQRRRTAANRRVKEMLDTGELGDVETVIAHQSVPNGLVHAEERELDPVYKGENQNPRADENFFGQALGHQEHRRHRPGPVGKGRGNPHSHATRCAHPMIGNKRWRRAEEAIFADLKHHEQHRNEADGEVELARGELPDELHPDHDADHHARQQEL
jgi:hypothetical protein